MAALGAAVLLVTRTLEPQKLYKGVDWGLLVFFVGLFLIVGGAENAGITGRLLDVARHWNLQRIGVFTIAVAGLCNIVNNVPAVMLVKSLVPGFANPHAAWLVLAMASTLAGNLTITGSVANVIVVESASQRWRLGIGITCGWACRLLSSRCWWGGGGWLGWDRELGAASFELRATQQHWLLTDLISCFC